MSATYPAIAVATAIGQKRAAYPARTLPFSPYPPLRASCFPPSAAWPTPPNIAVPRAPWLVLRAPCACPGRCQSPTRLVSTMAMPISRTMIFVASHRDMAFGLSPIAMTSEVGAARAAVVFGKGCSAAPSRWRRHSGTLVRAGVDGGPFAKCKPARFNRFAERPRFDRNEFVMQRHLDQRAFGNEVGLPAGASQETVNRQRSADRRTASAAG